MEIKRELIDERRNVILSIKEGRISVVRKMQKISVESFLRFSLCFILYPTNDIKSTITQVRAFLSNQEHEKDENDKHVARCN